MPRTKKLERRYLEHLASLLRTVVARDYDGNATSFARHIGVSQPQISQLLNPHAGTGVGIVILMVLRSHLHKSIDDLLGLPPLTSAASPADVREAINEALAAKAVASSTEMDEVRELLREFRAATASTAAPAAKRTRPKRA